MGKKNMDSSSGCATMKRIVSCLFHSEGLICVCEVMRVLW